MKAIWNDIVIADSDQTIEIEGNQYFPPNTVKKEYLEESRTHTTCPWKGEAAYYHVQVNGKVNLDAAWYYPDPKDAASEIRGYVAFWKGVEVKE
ncbi:DUF427 domain-containing protein [Pontibacter chitinilyticus]|uniref:DUF427 domain-containing protein n=1 Tax=Pontibacter chitinilyticus TaxID=2674989 RepID=UPI00321935F8